MPIEYRIHIDESYFATGLARCRKQNRGYRWFLAVKWVCGLILGSLVILLAAHGAFEGVVLLSFFLGLLAVSGRIDAWLERRRLRKWSRLGEEATFELSDEGVYIRESLAESRATWKYFQAARRAADGWLLFDDRGKARWLPDAATRSTPAEIEALLRTALAERVVG